jgi:hypothetical protein
LWQEEDEGEDKTVVLSEELEVEPEELEELVKVAVGHSEDEELKLREELEDYILLQDEPLVNFE